jgi:anaerobic magnesium-protoporphyrin IX monomethyl ester cyclase
MAKNIYLFYLSNNPLWRSFPNSLLALCNPLIKAGFVPKIIDTALEGWNNEPLVDPLFVGFTTFTDANILKALEVAKAIRARYPDLPLVWGGPHVIVLAEQTARHPLVDVACYGEGEPVVVELARSFEAGQKSLGHIPGIIWKDERGECVKNPPAAYVDLDQESMYPYQILNQKVYHLKRGKIYYEASRGCPFMCRFCSYDHSKWRHRSADNVVNDLALLEKQFSPEEIQVIDANHFMKLDWVEAIWSQKHARGLSFRWETNCRFDTISRMDERIFETIARSGCYQLRLGAESGSQKILDYLNKGITIEQILTGIERCQRHKINPLISFMIGYPHEDDKDIAATVSLINRIKKDFPRAEINGLFQFQPYPNTKIFDEITREYNIPQPSSLDGWAQNQIIEMHRTDFPWLDNRRYSRYQVMNSIVSYIFFFDKLRSMPQHQRSGIPLVRHRVVFWLFCVVDAVIRNTFVKLRWKMNVYAFPFEWHFWNFIRRHILKLF